jgi:hypothetical protein
MVMNSRCFRTMNTHLIALLAVGALASCGPMATSPQQVQSSNPTVTYNYRNDQELVQANRNATTFCGQYQTTPRTASITNNPDGSRAVVFECVRTTAAPPPPPAAPKARPAKAVAKTKTAPKAKATAKAKPKAAAKPKPKPKSKAAKPKKVAGKKNKKK